MSPARGKRTPALGAPARRLLPGGRCSPRSRRQDRVATTRGEIPTAGYTACDVQGGVAVCEGALLRVGVNNVFDRQYVNHLNARNPFTGTPIPEPGRVVFARLSYDF